MNPHYMTKRIDELAAEVVALRALVEALKERVRELEPRKPGRPRKDA